jgi:hypothetical protein
LDGATESVKASTGDVQEDLANVLGKMAEAFQGKEDLAKVPRCYLSWRRRFRVRTTATAFSLRWRRRFRVLVILLYLMYSAYLNMYPIYLKIYLIYLKRYFVDLILADDLFHEMSMII